jgi:hypothetical protein
MEPNYDFTNLLVLIVPFASYFLGIVIRKKALPGKNSPPLSHQLLIGIPVSLVVVSPMLPIISKTIADTPAFLVSMGIIMEHGMLVNETITKHLGDKIPGLRAQSN